MIRRTLLEWQSLRYGDKADEIPDWAANRLVAVARNSPLGGEGGGRILTHGRHSLRAGQVVGIVAAEGVSLEILPKIDFPDSEPGDEEPSQIRKRLVHMLAVALDLDIDGGALSTLSWQQDSLLEILIQIFTTKLIDAVRQGMPRRYIACEDDQPALRGRLDTIRQFTALAASPQKLACRYDTLSADIALNQIMKSAVERLRRIARKADNLRRLQELSLVYADIVPAATAALLATSIPLDRTNSRWKDLLALARLILGNRFQTTTSGSQTGFSLLFEMNTLFEQYVGRMLRRALAATDLTVHLQAGRLYCLEDVADGRQLFQTKPDILIKRRGAVVHVIDTKWKQISPRGPDGKQGVDQSDVYQMMAYRQLYDCGQLTLLYPHNSRLAEDPGVLRTHRIGTTTDRLHIATVSLQQSSGFAGQLRALVSAIEDMAEVVTAPYPASSPAP